MNAPDPQAAAMDPRDDLPLVLVVDDELRSQEAMRRTLDEDFRVLTAGDTDIARQLISRHEVAVVLCDQRMPGQTGIEFLKEVRERWPEVVRIVISGYADSEDIIAGVNEAGIYQYVLKPWVPEHLLQTVQGAVEASQLHRGLQRLELDLRAGPQALRARRQTRLREAKAVFDFDRIVRAEGSPLDGVCATAQRLARYDLSVLILGESGTGKEVAARAIHARSPRRDKPFVAINCGAIPPDLLESELFGHEKGAFTGALTQRKGRFEMAEGGTLLLDEIGDMPMAMQVKLLRVLQERVFERVGGGAAIQCDVRVVAATHRNLEAHIAEGKFREDLFYRLNVFPIEMPALRERSDDLPDLVAAITRQLAESGRGRVVLTAEAIAALQHYDWPGNVRELSNLLERLAVLNPDGRVGLDDLPARYRAAVPADFSPPPLVDEASAIAVLPSPVPAARPAPASAAAPASPAPPDPSTLSPLVSLPAGGLDLRQHIAEIENELIRQALQQTGGVVAHAAPLLGLRRTTLLEKLRKYGIVRSGDAGPEDDARES